MTKAIQLVDYLGHVRDVIQGTFKQGSWITAEISSLKFHSGHCYLELTEHDDTGRRVANCRSVIWKRQISSINKKFKDVTGSELNSDIKVMLLVKPDFHPSFGLSLNVLDIEPSFTLGDMARKLKDIRDKLLAENLYHNQKRLSHPYDFTHVAVLAPDGAAGLGDFQRDANRLAEIGAVRFDYYHAVFQGQNTNDSMLAQLRAIYKDNQTQNFDCLVIIRGGGSVTDLNYLNEYDLARAITKVTIPVFTAIGHERDTTILDEVSFQSFDTPSKSIHHILRAILNNVTEAEKNILRIAQSTEATLDRYSAEIKRADEISIQAPGQILENANNNVNYTFSMISRFAVEIGQNYERYANDLFHSIQQQVNNVLAESEKHTDQLGNQIVHLADNAFSNTNRNVERLGQNIHLGVDMHLNKVELAVSNITAPIPGHVQRHLDLAEQQTKQCVHDVSVASTNLVNRTEDQINHYHRLAETSSPKNTMARGFAIVRNEDGTAITNLNKAEALDEFNVEFRDGTLRAQRK